MVENLQVITSFTIVIVIIVPFAILFHIHRHQTLVTGPRESGSPISVRDPFPNIVSQRNIT
jgi:hypothetical protein